MVRRLILEIKMLAFMFALCLPACAQFPSWGCPEAELPEKVTPQEALAYLKGVRQNLSSDCVVTAIRALGTAHYKPAIDTLIHYLDFKVPIQPGRPRAVLAGTTGGLYPAADALERMDKSALSAVTRALTDNTLPIRSRVNAAKVVSDLEDDKPDAIRSIVRAARAANDVGAEDALLKEAKDRVLWCLGAEKQKCQEALNEQ